MDRRTIGDFARATGLTPKALRLYDETGLLRPAEVDEFSGYRYYRDEQLDRARLVARLRVIGMPLDRIRHLADLPDGARAAELTSYWRQVEADTASRRSRVAALVESLRTEESDMTMTDTSRPAVAWRTGTGARDSQLDALLTGSRVFAVADGFGSDPDVAARALAELAALDGVSGVVDPLRLLDEAVRTAGGTVAAPESGCTLTGLVLGDTDAAVAHVGDSRAYLVRDGRLTRLTRDHTEVQSLVDEGRLTDDEARSHEHRAQLNRALVAGRSASPDISLHAAQPGDRFALTTDGVHAVLRTDELASLLLGGGSADDVVTRIEDAVLAAGSPDNYAVVAVDLPAGGLSRGRA
jgi:DNA-binding transcriptional MerR regulator